MKYIWISLCKKWHFESEGKKDGLFKKRKIRDEQMVYLEKNEIRTVMNHKRQNISKKSEVNIGHFLKSENEDFGSEQDLKIQKI